MKRKPAVPVSRMPEPETRNESRHAKRGARNLFRRRENARAAASEGLEREAQAAGSALRKRNRKRALFAALTSLALLIGGTVGFSTLFSRLSAASILSANAGSFALGLALTLACAALIALLPSSRTRSEVSSESTDEPKPDRAASKLASFLRKPFLWTPVLGALAAGAEIGLFLLTGSARVSHGRAETSAGSVWLALWLDAGLALYPVLWVCGVLPLFEPARLPRLRRWFPLIGAALEAGWLMYARGCTAWTFVLNALLLGGLLYAFAGRARAWLPAAAGVFAFSAVARLFGEAAPDRKSVV